MISLPLWFCGSTLTTASIICAVDHREREGTTVGAVTAIRAGIANWFELAAARLRVFTFLIAGLPFLVPAVVFAIRYSLIEPIAVLEVHRSAKRVMEASKALVEGRLRSVVSIRVLSFLAGALVAWPFSVALQLSGTESVWATTSVVLVSEIVGVYSTVAMFVLYKNLAQLQWAPKTAVDGDPIV